VPLERPRRGRFEAGGAPRREPRSCSWRPGPAPASTRAGCTTSPAGSTGDGRRDGRRRGARCRDDDAATTIDTALAGIAGQSSPPAAVLVVDDGSSDATADTARAWQHMLPVRVERLTENVGVGSARSHALSLVETPLVAILDADDFWLTDHVRALTDVAAPQRLVFARDLLWSPGSWVRVTDRRLPPRDEQLRALVHGNLSSAGVMFHRDDYERAGGYRAGLRASEDWDLYLRMVRGGVEMVLAPEPTLVYRIDASSTSAGYQTVDSDVDVLEHAGRETTDVRERAWIERELARRRARQSLARALDAAASGRPRDARRYGRAAMRGAAMKTRVIAAALALTPRLASRLRAHASRRRWGS
jgi:glycosyltransferase involved in cell wall biosynthesis